MTTVYLNGEWVPLERATVSVLDRGFIFGDGVYEVIPVYGRRPFRLSEHLARLQASMDGIRLANPYPTETWTTLIGKLIEQHEWADQSVYVQVTRGVAPRNHAFPKDAKPTVFIMTGPLSVPSREERDNGVDAITLNDYRWIRCNIKSTALLANCMLKQAAVEAGCAEAILLRDGFLTEGSSTNIFVVKGNMLLAPPKSHLILPGITYDVLIELARAHGMPIEVRPVSESEVRSAEELWLSSSSKEVLAITRLDGEPVGNGKPGPMYRKMAGYFESSKSTRSAAPAHA
ncbi:MAG: D-amino acid aminotransferase [Burkholderiales bacterium]